MGNGHSSAYTLSLGAKPHTTSNVQLPPEVIAQILTAICESAEASGHDYKKYLACSALTCRSWQNAIRPYLYASLALRTPADLDHLLIFLDENESVRTRVARLELHETDEPWISDALRILPDKLPAVSSLHLSSEISGDSSQCSRKADILPELCAQLTQIHELALAGAAFGDVSAFIACTSAFPSLTRVHCRGITWSQYPQSHPDSAFNYPTVQVDAADDEVPWAWILVDPFGHKDIPTAAPHPTLADADAAAFARLVRAAMYASTSCTCSLDYIQGPDDPHWNVSIQCSQTGNSASVSIAPAPSDEAQDHRLATIRAASLHLTPKGSTVNADDSAFVVRLAGLDCCFATLPSGVQLSLDWEYWGTVDHYVRQALRSSLFQRLSHAKRLVYRISKGKAPGPLGCYLPRPFKYRM